jgi:hypothetical protein
LGIGLLNNSKFYGNFKFFLAYDLKNNERNDLGIFFPPEIKEILKNKLKTFSVERFLFKIIESPKLNE